MPPALPLAQRRLVPEVMDDPSLGVDAHREALRGLARLNHASSADAPIWRAIRPAAVRAAEAGRPLRVLDVACGGGDVPLALLRRADAEGIALELTGCDISDTALQHARDAARRQRCNARFIRRDVLSDGLPAGFDVATSSLFLHHLERDDAVRAMSAMRGAAGRVIVSDLERGALGLAAAWVGTRVLSRSRVVHVDGPRSVRAAYTRSELLAVAEEAGLTGATVRRVWPFRVLLTWEAA